MIIMQNLVESRFCLNFSFSDRNSSEENSDKSPTNVICELKFISIPWLRRRVSSPRHIIYPVLTGGCQKTCRIPLRNHYCFHPLHLWNLKIWLKILMRTSVMKLSGTKLLDSTFSWLQKQNIKRIQNLQNFHCSRSPILNF